MQRVRTICVIFYNLPFIVLSLNQFAYGTDLVMKANNFVIKAYLKFRDLVRGVPYLMAHTPRMYTHSKGFVHIFQCGHKYRDTINAGFFLVMHAKGMKGMRLHRKVCQGSPCWNFEYFISILQNFSPGIQWCTLFLHLSSVFLEYHQIMFL
jgi:hypothetical protein